MNRGLAVLWLTSAFLPIKTIYLRLFDVDWNEQQNRAVPVAIVSFKDSIEKHISYVAVMFITPAAWRGLLHEGVRIK